IYGATLAGYVPLSAIMPCLAPQNKGAAISMLNLGAAASTWLGPTIVALLLGPLGVVGVIWIFAVLHLISGFLSLFLTLPADVEHAAVAAPDRKAIGVAAFATAGGLLGHAPAMHRLLGETGIDLILFHIGGTIYDDDTYSRALFRAASTLNPEMTESEFWE